MSTVGFRTGPDSIPTDSKNETEALLLYGVRLIYQLCLLLIETIMIDTRNKNHITEPSSHEMILEEHSRRESNIMTGTDKIISDILIRYYPNLSEKELAICRQVFFSIEDHDWMEAFYEEVVTHESTYKRVYVDEKEVRTLVNRLVQRRILRDEQSIFLVGPKEIPRKVRMLTFVDKDLILNQYFHNGY